MPSRRSLLRATLATAAAGALSSFAAPADAATDLMTDADIDRLLPSISNWGRWGKEDQLGTLNFITPEMRIRAAQSVLTGRVVPLAHERGVADPEGVRKLGYHMSRYQDPRPEESGAIDEIGMIYHGFTITHLDALCHMFTPEGAQGMYNGFSISEVTDQGAGKLGVEVMGATGIVGRGLLLDIARLRGGPLPLGSIITPEDLEAAEVAQGVFAGTGDILFIRNGAGAQNSYKLGTGLHPACLPWLHARRVALLSSDSDSDVHPPQPGPKLWTEPVHMIAIPYLGMPLICGADLEGLSAACGAEGRWTFLLTVAPWRFKGATSSPVNPLALF